MKCPRCSCENPADSKFCNNCGVKLGLSPATGKSVLDGERKVITVLFTDVVNYTVISAQLDSEVVKQIMDGCFRVLIEQVHRYDGTVDKLLGDGLMALFGAPLAYEDHAQRACYAALGIQEAIRKYAEKVQKEQSIEFKMRTGLNSGLVTVGAIGSDQKIDYTAVGDTVNLASRLEGAAGPGTILVSGDTYSITKDFFHFESSGELQLKGKEQVVPAYRLIAARKTETRFAAAVARGLTSFVGREREIKTLKAAFAVAAKGDSRVMGISGEPGVGKSRLLHEFRRSPALEAVTYLEGRCVHYAGAIPFRPLLDIIMSYFGIAEGDSETSARDKMIEKVGGLDENLAGYLPFLYEVLSFKIEDEHFLRMENQYRRSKLFEGIAGLLMKESSRQPLVIAIEDLHWLDKASEEFLTYFIGRFGDSRILLLLLYRPEYTPPWDKRSDFVQLHLEELPTPTSSELLKSLLPGGEPEPEMRDLVLSKAGGNPLFLEEFVHTLLENGTIQKDDGHYSLNALASTIRLPDTIQGIIAARIDRLPESLKNILQAASVIGRDFSYTLLQEVTQLPGELKSHLETLQRLELITQRGVYPEIECVFKHALIQDVAYNSLLQKRKKELHESIGQGIERLYFNRIGELSEVLAYHFRQGESIDKAIGYLVKAGKKSHNRYACEEAHKFFNEAVELLSSKPYRTRDDETWLIDIIIDWAVVFYYRSDWKGLIEVLTTHNSLVETINNKRQKAWFLGWMGFSVLTRGRPREAYRYLRQAHELAEASGDRKAIAYMNCWLVYACYSLALTKEAKAYGERALAISRSVGDDDYPYIKTVCGIGLMHCYAGEIKKALEYGNTLVQFGINNGNARGIFMGNLVLGVAYLYAGEWSKMTDIYQRFSETTVDPVYSALQNFIKGMFCFATGHLEEAEIEIKQFLEFDQIYGMELFGNPASGLWGLILMSKGQMSRGFRLLRKATAICRENDCFSDYATMELCQGQVYAQMAAGAKPVKPSLLFKNIGFMLMQFPFAGRRAVKHFNKAAQILMRTDFAPALGNVYFEMGRFYQKKGKKALASENLIKAIQQYKQSEATGYLREAESLLAVLEKNEGKH